MTWAHSRRPTKLSYLPSNKINNQENEQVNHMVPSSTPLPSLSDGPGSYFSLYGVNLDKLHVWHTHPNHAHKNNWTTHCLLFRPSACMRTQASPAPCKSQYPRQALYATLIPYRSCSALCPRERAGKEGCQQWGGPWWQSFFLDRWSLCPEFRCWCATGPVRCTVKMPNRERGAVLLKQERHTVRVITIHTNTKSRGCTVITQKGRKKRC